MRAATNGGSCASAVAASEASTCHHAWWPPETQDATIGIPRNGLSNPFQAAIAAPQSAGS